MVRLARPSVVVNFKTYGEGSGGNSEKLARSLAVNGVILAVQNADIYRVCSNVKVPVFAQHVDPVGCGQFTGKDEAGTLKANGASGVLINHSEDKVSVKSIRDCINIARKAGLTTVVCIDKPGMARAVAMMGPDMIAIEPPELIGTGISVSKAKPQVITKTVDAVKKANKNVDVLCGAGISTKEDVRKAMDLGCSGVLVASAIVTAKRPDKVMREFLSVL